MPKELPENQDAPTDFKSRWEWIWSIGAMITSVLAGFLQAPPPPSSVQDNFGVTRFAQFAITIVAGIVLLIGVHYRRPKAALKWVIVSGVCLLIAVGFYVYYSHLLNQYTRPYNNARVIIGSPDSLRAPYDEEGFGEKSVEEIIEDHAGAVHEIWDQSSIDRRRIHLMVVFIFTLPFFTVSMVSIVEAWQCHFSSNRERSDHGEVSP